MRAGFDESVGEVFNGEDAGMNGRGEKDRLLRLGFALTASTAVPLALSAGRQFSTGGRACARRMDSLCAGGILFGGPLA